MICSLKLKIMLTLSSSQGSLDGESADLLERMRRKNEKRLKRMREIEQDKLMFA